MKDKPKSIEQELSEIAPFLANLKKEGIEPKKPEIPVNYFKDLSNEIFEKTILQSAESVSNTTIRTVKKESVFANISVYFQWVLRPGVALTMTSVVLLLIAGIYLVNQPTENSGDNLTAAEIQLYIEDNIETFDVEQLSDLVVSTNENIFETIELQDVEAADLEEYIEENYIEDLEIDELM